MSRPTDTSRQTVTLATTKGPRTVEAEVVGPFAVHDRLYEYTVTHRKTGRSAWSFPTEDAALDFAIDLRDLLADAGYEDSDDPEEVRDRIVEAVQELAREAETEGGEDG